MAPQKHGYDYGNPSKAGDESQAKPDDLLVMATSKLSGPPSLLRSSR
jgi:hypothetical protein